MLEANKTDISRYDGLFFGRRTFLTTPDDIDDGCPPDDFRFPASSFHTRDPVDVQKDFWLRYELSHLADRVKFQIVTRTIAAPQMGNEIFTGVYYSEWWNPTFDEGTVRICAEAVLPLLRDDLAPTERLAQELDLARTVSRDTL